MEGRRAMGWQSTIQFTGYFLYLSKITSLNSGCLCIHTDFKFCRCYNVNLIDLQRGIWTEFERVMEVFKV